MTFESDDYTRVLIAEADYVRACASLAREGMTVLRKRRLTPAELAHEGGELGVELIVEFSPDPGAFGEKLRDIGASGGLGTKAPE